MVRREKTARRTALALFLVFSFPPAYAARSGPDACEQGFGDFLQLPSPRRGESAQEQIWRLQESGQSVQAALLEKSLVTSLTQQSIVGRRKIDIGVSKPEKVKLAGGISGVLKSYSQIFYRRGYKSEVAAYRLDRLLGLNVVPVTVDREVHGVACSLQYFVEGAKHGLDAAYLSRGLANDRIRLLDYLTANIDTHGRNLLVTAEGRQIAIDHGLTFTLLHLATGRPELERLSRNLLEKGVDRALLQRLRLTPDHAFRSALAGLVPEAAIDALIHRRDILLEVAGMGRKR